MWHQCSAHDLAKLGTRRLILSLLHCFPRWDKHKLMDSHSIQKYNYITTRTNTTTSDPHQKVYVYQVLMIKWNSISRFCNRGSEFLLLKLPHSLKLSQQPSLVFWEILMHTSMWKGSKFLLVVFIDEAGTWKCALACLLLRCRHLSAFNIHTCHSRRESVIFYTRSLLRSFPTNITSQLFVTPYSNSM